MHCRRALLLGAGEEAGEGAGEEREELATGREKNLQHGESRKPTTKTEESAEPSTNKAQNPVLQDCLTQ